MPQTGRKALCGTTLRNRGKLMKILKRILAVILLIAVCVAIGYFVYTGTHFGKEEGYEQVQSN